MVKLVDPLVNRDQLLWIVNGSLVRNETRLLSSKIQIYQTIYLLVN